MRGSHQIDLAVKTALEMLMRELFIYHMTRLIAFLRSQKFISFLSETCPDYRKTRCLSLGRVCRSLIAHKQEVYEEGDKRCPVTYATEAMVGRRVRNDRLHERFALKSCEFGMR